MILCKCRCDYLLAIDPGLMTGVCLIDLRNPEDPVMLWSDEVTVSEFHDKIADLVSQEKTHVVMEDFKITVETGKLSEQPWSLHLIGVVNYLGYLHGTAVDMQLPSQKPFATSEKMKMVGFWHVGEAGHANDSLKHALIWIVDRNRKWTKKMLV